ncbi:hypothetical protein EUX98_g5991 [Antrodiella citrinella]|uniref:Uncharacterized protein n=1 Tax=Antrodiella citrinella TaxID=2447956 RepID=A0A4S4MSP6_9APHY|nr:hypothetical protein EUX98_g5991 [Antrodiella citrinella]
MSSQSTNNPDSDHTELYYTDLEDERAGSSSDTEDTSSSSDGERDRKYELRRVEQKYGKGKVEDKKGKGVSFSEPQVKVPFASHGHDRPTKEKREEKRTWYDLDLSLVVALVSPIGNWLTGSDHVKNLFLILLLIFYLHQLIEGSFLHICSLFVLPISSYNHIVPWQLYHASRPRKAAKRVPRTNALEPTSLAHLAHTELRKQELFFLTLAVVSPLLGATLIRFVLTTLEGVDNLSWFSTTLFVLATAIRPWSHLMGRLQERTHELHDTVHYPSEDSDARHQLEVDRTLRTIIQRLDALDSTVRDLEENTDKIDPLREVCDDLSEAIGTIERTASRMERKAETTRVTQDTRINLLENGLVELEGRRRRAQEEMESRFRLSTYTHLYAGSRLSFLSTLLNLPSKLSAFATPYMVSFLPPNSTSITPEPINLTVRNPPILDEVTTPQFLTRLETIPEADDSDSEGTYVSDKDSNSATPSRKLVTPGKDNSRSRSRSISHGRKKGARALSPQSKVIEYAKDVMAWPYKSAVHLLLIISPPVQKLFL